MEIKISDVDNMGEIETFNSWKSLAQELAERLNYCFVKTKENKLKVVK